MAENIVIAETLAQVEQLALAKLAALREGPTGSSPQIGQLALALSRAQGAFFPPVRNRTVEVQPANPGHLPYTFSYSTLDKVIDMIRLPLCNHELAVVNQVFPMPGGKGGSFMATRVIHSSGQWMESRFPLLTDSHTVQALGGAKTYAQRYNLTGLLNIASEEDLDGAQASGLSIREPAASGEQAEQQAGRQLNEMLSEWTKRCNRAGPARRPEAVADLLQFWNDNRSRFMAVRAAADPSRIDTPWDTAIRLFAQVVESTFSRHLGELWTGIMETDSVSDLEHLKARWHGPVMESARLEMKAGSERAYNLFHTQLLLRSREIEEQGERFQASPEARLVIEVPIAASEPPAPPPLSYSTYLLVDAVGDPMNDETTDPAVFLRQYEQMLEVAEDPGAIEIANAGGVAAAHEELKLLAASGEPEPEPVEAPSPAPSVAEPVDRAPEQVPEVAPPAEPEPEPQPDPTPEPEAEEDGQLGLFPAPSPAPAALEPVVLEPGVPTTPQRSLLVALKRKPNGSPDIMAYLMRMKASLDAIKADQLPAWHQANAAAIAAAPGSLPGRVRDLLAARAKQLGVEVPR